MEKFRADTKQEKLFVDDNTIVRQLLATQTSRENWREVFNMVSNNYDAINYRAPGVLEMYNENPPPFSVDSLFRPEESIAAAYDCPIIASFVEKNNLGDQKEKALALFFASRDFHNQEKISPVAIGELLKSLSFGLPNDDDDDDNEAAKQEEEIDININNNNENPIGERVPWSLSDHENAWNEIGAIQEMKLAANLPTSSYSAPFVCDLLSRGYTADGKLLNAIDMLAEASINEIMATGEVSTFGAANNRDAIKTYISNGKIQESVASVLRSSSSKIINK